MCVYMYMYMYNVMLSCCNTVCKRIFYPISYKDEWKTNINIIVYGSLCTDHFVTLLCVNVH